MAETSNGIGDEGCAFRKKCKQIPTTISADLSIIDLILGEYLTISGRINPPPETAGQGVSIELVSPSGAVIYQASDLCPFGPLRLGLGALSTEDIAHRMDGWGYGRDLRWLRLADAQLAHPLAAGSGVLPVLH